MGMRGFIGRLLSFTRTSRGDSVLDDVKADPGAGANLTADHFGPAGDDVYPLPQDYVAILPIPGRGRGVVVGYADPKNDQKAFPGERRMYARDISGASVAEIWIRQNGAIEINNDSGSITLQANGTIDLNGATIDTNGELVCSDAVINNVRFSTHIHTQPNDSGGDTESPTAGPESPP